MPHDINVAHDHLIASGFIVEWYGGWTLTIYRPDRTTTPREVWTALDGALERQHIYEDLYCDTGVMVDLSFIRE